MSGKRRDQAGYGLGEHRVTLDDVAAAAHLGRDLGIQQVKANPFRDIFHGISRDIKNIFAAQSEEIPLTHGTVLTERGLDGTFSLWTSRDETPFRVRLYALHPDGDIDYDRPIADSTLHHVGIQSWFGTQESGLDLTPSVGVVLMEDVTLNRYPGMSNYFDSARPEDGVPYHAVDKLFENASDGFVNIIHAENPALIEANKELVKKIPVDQQKRLKGQHLPVIHGFPSRLLDFWRRIEGAVTLNSSSGRIVTPGSFKDQIPGRSAIFVEGAWAIDRETFKQRISFSRKRGAMGPLMNVALDGYDAGNDAVLSEDDLVLAALARTAPEQATTFFESVARRDTTLLDRYPVVAWLRPHGRALAVPRKPENPRLDYRLNQMMLAGLAAKAGRTAEAIAEAKKV